MMNEASLYKGFGRMHGFLSGRKAAASEGHGPYICYLL